MAKNPLKIERVNSIWYLFEDIYKVPSEQVEKWTGDREKEIEVLMREARKKKSKIEKIPEVDTPIIVKLKGEIVQLISEMVNSKKMFLEETKTMKGHTLFISAFSDIFLFSEIETKKDFMYYSYDEILDVVKKLVDLKIITSSSKYYNYCNIISQYTEWAYNKGKRKDYIITKDMTKRLPYKSIAKQMDISNTVMTWSDMLAISKKCGRYDAEILIRAMMEGLTTKEVLNIQVSDFKEEDGLLNVGNRFVEVSEELYKLMKSYSKIEYLPSENRYATFERELADTGYLIRPTKRGSNEILKEPMQAPHFTANVSKDLKEIGYDIGINNFRSSAMLNDAIDGKSVEYINKKYSRKYANIALVVSERLKLEILEMKRRKEGTLIQGALKIRGVRSNNITA